MNSHAPVIEEDIVNRSYGPHIKDNTLVLSNEGALSLLSELMETSPTDTIAKTQHYLDKIVSTASSEDAGRINDELLAELGSLRLAHRRGQSSVTLKPFEAASLINLVREGTDVGDVEAWLPSLGIVAPEDIKVLIDTINRKKETYTSKFM